MHRFYIAPGSFHAGKLELTGNEAHHAARVLRVRVGEIVQVLDGAGTEFACEVAGIHRDTVSLDIKDSRKAPPIACEVTLLQAIPKGKIIESIIQKATELGAHRIVPLLSERVLTHLDSESGHSKAEKWQHTAIEAVKQCGAPWLPRVEEPVALEEFIRRRPVFDMSLVASLRPGSRPPRHFFSGWEARHGRMPKSVCLWIGPEGDFSPREYDAIEASGALPVSLGSLVLRVETAAIYCLSVIHHELHAGKQA